MMMTFTLVKGFKKRFDNNLMGGGIRQISKREQQTTDYLTENIFLDLILKLQAAPQRLLY